MPATKWMRKDDGEPILVEDSQVAQLVKQGYSECDPPPSSSREDLEPTVKSATGPVLDVEHQLMYKGDDFCVAVPRQLARLREDGWSSSKGGTDGGRKDDGKSERGTSRGKQGGDGGPVDPPDGEQQPPGGSGSGSEGEQRGQAGPQVVTEDGDKK